jgi:hypothetical protein
MAQNGVEAEQLSTNLVDCPMAGCSVDYQVLPTAHGQFKLIQVFSSWNSYHDV